MQLNRTSIRDALGQEQSRVQIKQGKWQAGQSWHPCNITELIHVLMMSLVTPFRKTASWLSTSRTWAFGEQGEQGCSARGTWAGSPGDPSTGTPQEGTQPSTGRQSQVPIMGPVSTPDQWGNEPGGQPGAQNDRRYLVTQKNNSNVPEKTSK